MIKLPNIYDIAVASRVKRYISKIFTSTLLRKFFGKLLFGLNHDVQEGPKVPTESGFVVENIDITFDKRENGDSKVSFLKTSLEICLKALSVRTIQPIHFLPTMKDSMQGAGVEFKRRKYITHTTLNHSHSAIQTFIRKQKLAIAILIIITLLGLFTKPLLTAQTILGVLSFIYFLDVVFNFFLITKSLHVPQEITSPQEELAALRDADLPDYTILCPLYKEAHVISHFLDSLSKIEWPKEKLEVQLLLEEDDKESIEAVKQMKLPAYVRSVVVPHSMPKTKPKACNYGLSQAKGEYLVIYDAEDMPDPLQLKKAYLGFQKVGEKVLCLQAKLNYYNPHQNLLTRFFTAEYSLWFDVTLTGLQAANTSIPLGGTSNHFKTVHLRELEGWDPFNVTEDADLGIRLFKKGYRTAIIESVTLEEANSNVFNWIRQRSRWIKGYMQTYLVHTRENFSAGKNNLYHTVLFHMNIGGKIAFILINPFLWITTIAYFALRSIVGPSIEALYPSYIFYMALISLVAGNFMFLYYYMIGCAKKDQWELIKYVYLIPLYWMLISWSGFVAFYQLLFKPHYWEKTIHGLHLKKAEKGIIAEIVIQTEEKKTGVKFPVRFRNAFLELITKRKTYITGASLVVASFVGNLLNFASNIFFGRVQNFEDFGLLSLMSGLLYLSTIPLNALGSTVTYRSGFLDSRYGKGTTYRYWDSIRRKTLLIGIVTSSLWLLATPLLMKFFATDELLPFVLFSFIWLSGFTIAVDKGYLSGKLLFFTLGLTIFVEPLSKILIAAGVVFTHNLPYAYLSIVLPSLVVFITAWFFATITKPKEKETMAHSHEISHFPTKFYIASLLSGLSSMTFLSLDVILAKHFLTPVQAGEYALISLTGKIVYFLGGLASQFILPVVSRKEGERKSSIDTLYYTIIFTALLTSGGAVLFGLFGYLSMPLLFGYKSIIVIPYLIPFTIAMMSFTLARIFVNYYLVKKTYTFSLLAFALSIFQFVFITVHHENISSIVYVMLLTGLLSLIVMLLCHFNIKHIKTFESNFIDFINLFSNDSIPESESTKEKRARNILIFNWRDTQHTWAGGAEMYIHELAKVWVKEGNIVTVFAGNDRKRAHEEFIDGVHIVRHGGFYTVYFWAFIYYALKFRGKYDVIIDSENGIPFFTPLYVRKPVYLLIHHVHQEVFREHLQFPYSLLAQWIESKFMPFFYRNTAIVTVSQSSKKEIIKLGLGNEESINVIHPGITIEDFFKSKKTTFPSLLYLGRLKPYKNIDTAIKAFYAVTKDFSKAKFYIAGSGEAQKSLKLLTRKLNLEKHIKFLGAVDCETKQRLLAQSWTMIQPSTIEGWGITVIEANASGTPVIASNVNGLKDSIQQNITGIMVHPKDISGFSNAIYELFTNKQLRRELSEQAYEWATRFSWSKSAHKFYGVLVTEREEIQTTAIGINVVEN